VDVTQTDELADEPKDTQGDGTVYHRASGRLAWGWRGFTSGLCKCVDYVARDFPGGCVLRRAIGICKRVELLVANPLTPELEPGKFGSALLPRPFLVGSLLKLPLRSALTYEECTQKNPNA
jgi:hypothetical protein